MKAYKVFNSDWTCRGFKFEVGKEYFQEGEIEICKNGFHACKKIADCFSYYSFDPNNKVAEVELSGLILGKDEDKQCASNIRIVRELSWEEVLKLANSGHSNSGHRNSGHRNSGDSNSGHRNSGDSNSGDSNSGDSNSGHRNSGDSNSGDSNSGDWNSGDWNSGFFNSDEPGIRLFNKETSLKRSDIYIPSVFYFNLTQWVSHDTATDEEKENYKDDIEVCGGFLKTLDYKTAFKRAWSNATEKERDVILNLPGFDQDVFYEISGVQV